MQLNKNCIHRVLFIEILESFTTSSKIWKIFYLLRVLIPVKRKLECIFNGSVLSKVVIKKNLKKDNINIGCLHCQNWPLLIYYILVTYASTVFHTLNEISFGTCVCIAFKVHGFSGKPVHCEYTCLLVYEMLKICLTRQ